MELSAKVITSKYTLEKENAGQKDTILSVSLVLAVCAFTGIMIVGAIAQPELLMPGIALGAYPLS